MLEDLLDLNAEMLSLQSIPLAMNSGTLQSKQEVPVENAMSILPWGYRRSAWGVSEVSF